MNNIPALPGVYFFKDAQGRIIYIGKSASLKARVKSYFVKNALRGIKASMLTEIVNIDYKTTDTEIDALILESQLIKKHRPKYNVLLKDDKNYFYVILTNDIFPKIFISHQPPKFQILNSKFYLLGPYTDGQALKTTLRYLRKIFPYCTCKNNHNNKCLKAHLGLCLGVCCASSTNNPQQTTHNKIAKDYKNNIKSIIEILSGRKKSILKRMEKEMKVAVKKEDFEKAAKIRDRISGLKNVFEHRVFRYFDDAGKDGRNIEKIKNSLREIFGAEINRIEFYDISNIQGQLATASMVVFDGEDLNKSQYRKFKIKTVFGADDPAMMEEVLKRRFKRSVSELEDKEKWPMPDLIIVDGGITQLGAAKMVLNFYGLNNVKVASLAKNPDRLFLSPLKQIALKDLSQDVSRLLQNLRDEAHRFAISYHKRLRSKKLKREFMK